MMKEKNFTPYEIVRRFEQIIADYAGAKYAVAVSSCTSAIFLCCHYLKVGVIFLPKFTYPGVACSILHAGGSIVFKRDTYWQGIYQLEPYRIYDSALRFKKDMYIKNSLYCLSFHYKKHIPIGRGGMILCDDKKIYEWLKQARFDGRHEQYLSKDKITMLGWNEYMTPEQAARGLVFFDMIKDKELPDLEMQEQGYPNLSKFKIFRK